MSYRFLVFINERGEDQLCEGGVYTDDESLLKSEESYRENDFAGLEDTVSRLNGMSKSGQYAARDTFECRLDKFDFDVLTSLNEWQKNALVVRLNLPTEEVVDVEKPEKKTYFGSSYLITGPDILNDYITLGEHEQTTASEANLPYRSVRVSNSADVELQDDDSVWLDRYGRVTGFESGGECYVIGES